MCKCCERIEFWGNEKSDYVDHKLFVKLSQYGWRKGERKTKGKQATTITTRAYNLKYCPSCGIKIKKKG